MTRYSVDRITRVQICDAGVPLACKQTPGEPERSEGPAPIASLILLSPARRIFFSVLARSLFAG